jgi:site-specific DNA-methyltransferase (adenine-specific)
VTAATLALGDCLEVLPLVPSGSVDLVLVDLPYGITACDWDKVIPFDKMWEQLLRVGKKACAYVFFAQQPFTTDLINSNRKAYRYNWTWLKNKASGFQYARFQPMRRTEDVCVFYRSQPKYNKQGEPYTEAHAKFQPGDAGGKALHQPMSKYQPDVDGGEALHQPKTRVRSGDAGGKALQSRTVSSANPFSGKTTGKGQTIGGGIYTYTHKTKTNVIEMPGVSSTSSEDALFRHPTQKPVAVLRYLIEAYTEPGDVVLDFTMGIGSTGVAAVQLGRRFFGIEKDLTYFTEAERRIEAARQDGDDGSASRSTAGLVAAEPAPW